MRYLSTGDISSGVNTLIGRFCKACWAVCGEGEALGSAANASGKKKVVSWVQCRIIFYQLGFGPDKFSLGFGGLGGG